eukprot:scaffold39865_cov278-Skeletonema_dohrnii-CCMP3373.AAC.1
MSDVSFLVDGHEVFANRSILSIRSEYFDCMLFGGMRESLRDEHGKAAGGPIELRDVSHPGVEYPANDCKRTIHAYTFKGALSRSYSDENHSRKRHRRLHSKSST